MESYKHTSWLELLDSSNSAQSEITTQQQIRFTAFEAHDDEDTRQLEIEIFDRENEKKFDKLVKEKKIKSPFKRRLSNDKLSSPEGDKQAEKKHKFEVLKDADEEESNGESPKKRFRSESVVSTESSTCSTGGLPPPREYETDPATLERRQKQIDYGKNTVGYDNYIKQVPKHLRNREHPKTPPKQLKYSRRAWEGLVKAWRKKLHAYDPDNNNEKEESD